MNINIKGLHMNLTPAITEYIHTKLSTLGKLVTRHTYVYVECGRTSDHHKSGNEVYMAEITLEDRGETHFAQVRGTDLYPAIDQVIHHISEQIKTNASKERSLFRRGHALLKKILRRE